MIAKIRESKDVIIVELEKRICRPPDRVDEKPTLHEFVKSELQKGKRKFLINFQNVEFIDSSGVGEILAISISIQNLGGKLRLVGFSQSLSAQIGFIDPRLEARPFDTEETALESLEEHKRKRRRFWRRRA